MLVSTGPGRRRRAFEPDFLIRVGIAWLATSALLVVINWSAIAAFRFPDPDDTLRLVQVRDLLAGQNWFDLTQYRVDAPGGGVAMHWSRLVDLPLAIVIGALTPIFGASTAELIGVVTVPLITLFCAMLLAARIAWRLMGEEEATLTALIMAICVPVLFQIAPMRIDHHGWQLVCALVAVNGLMARNPKVGGAIMGASLATWLAISIEGLPLAAAIFAVLALRWLRDREAKVILVSAIQSLALTSIALFLLTRGIGDLISYCDAISPVHLGMFAWGGVVLSLLGRLEPMPRGALIVGFAVAGGGALAMMFVSAPQCVSGGGFAALDPVVREFWYENVHEGMPVWHQTLKDVLQYAITPLIGLYAAVNLAAQSRDWLRRFWGDYAMILGAAILISLLVARAGAAACVLAAPPLAWQLRQWLRSIRTFERPHSRVAAMVAVACALFPAFPLVVLTNAMPAQALSGGGARIGAPPVKVSQCRIAETAALLADLPQGEVYAPLDISPRILLDTEHSVIATGHHRGNLAMRFVIETATATPENARIALAQRGTRYIAICPDLTEPRLYEAAAPDGFMARLRTDNAPDWLEPVALDTDASLRVWRVKQD